MNIQSILQAINQQLSLYPVSTLIDIYKSFFQDAFGVGHLIGNKKNNRIHFEYELETMKSWNRRLIEPCGVGRQFYRIPMDFITDGIIDKEEFYLLFCQSSLSFSIPKIKEWRE